ncbi:MAG: glycosyltransferase family 4 protein, partial [Ignavibacteria bacterium]
MRKALVISYYFPPMGMGGVQRTAKFVKYLPEFGWKPIVLTDTPKAYFARDEGLLDELVNGQSEIYRTECTGSKNLLTEDNVFRFQNEGIRKIFSYLGQTFLIPDTKRLWKNKALKLAEQILCEHKIDVLYATAPPYTDFLIGCELKNKFNIPLVLDYRDSWLDCPINFYLTPLHKTLNKNLEENVLRNADKIISINGKIKELILQKYTFLNREDILVIPHGFDQEDFNINGFHLKESEPFPKRKMRITYAGSFLYYYTPKYFIEGLAKVFQLEPHLKGKIEACFIGIFPEKYVKFFKKLNLYDSVNLTGYLKHSDCVRYLLASDVLWLMLNKTHTSDIISTGKLYEYFGARKPILACLPDGVAKDSLKDYGAAKICEPDDPEAIAKLIIEFYKLYEKNNLPKP